MPRAASRAASSGNARNSAVYYLVVILRALILFSFLLAATSASAQQYRWVDEKGRVHYTDTPPPPSAKSAQKKNLKANELGQQPSYELTQAIRKAPVTLYTFPDCKDPCQMARDVLNKRGVPFKEKLISNQQMLDELKQVSGGLNVPVLVVGNQVEKTASPQAFNQALDIGGYPAAGAVRPGNQKEPAAPKPPPQAAPTETPAAPR
jgi:glutaredoxin